MSKPAIENIAYGKHDLCVSCGHFQFLHQSSFKGECEACDTPEVPMDRRCPAFNGGDGDGR